ncbi:hypothetical protein RPMA_17000 [Tardiphaga alba]|uniref:Uncharacterized protein n=1 Tax=Tardiphaga alba TaxID=340268 RepID=A0ABX8AD82_9BRAD|nr:hypothetical protein [Tardiphaga alba]QUS40345.1 hypothetical protein RPMA_17000 [Tardiphaga alba]
MSIKNSSLRMGALALFATVAAAAQPAIATAAPAKAPSASVSQQASDFSAARRHHNVQRRAVRDAYGAYVGGGATAAPSSQPYGYGVGDNSRGQTW